MLQGGGDMRPKGPRPNFRVCYLCGQQFGTASIGIHVPQCYQKKVSQWEAANPAVRGSKPKHPDTVNWKGTKGASAQQVNEEQYREFEANMVPCPNCGRTFLPDRLVVHQRSCKPKPGAQVSARTKEGGSSASNGAATGGARPTTSGGAGATDKASGGGGGSRSSSRSGKSQTRSSMARREPTGPPLLPFCYLCGRQFGTKSIDIHVPQCYQKKLSQWEAADPFTRGKPPAHPDTISKKTSTATSLQEQSDAQFKEFVNQLDPCPNCGRKFLSDRLIVHLRSCKPGSTSKPVAGGASTERETPLRVSTSHDQRVEEAARLNASGRLGASRSSSLANSDRAESKPNVAANSSARLGSEGEETSRIDPRKNRVPTAAAGRTNGRKCTHCCVVEYDASAKFCRECGWNLNAKRRQEPCQSCGENLPVDSRFCATCGEPVDGAAGTERGPGGESENVPTVRVAVCPACEVLCDADGNFCDNCGAALGTVELSPKVTAGSASATKAKQQASTSIKEYMYCSDCNETVDNLTAVFCEECGKKLELRSGPDPSAPPPGSSTSKTLPPISSNPTNDNGNSSSKGAPKQRETPSLPATEAPQQPRKSASSAKAPTPAPPVAPAEMDFGESGIDGGDDADRVECQNCGRKFASEAYMRHMKICSSQKRRPVFNTTKQRLADCDVPPQALKAGGGASRASASASAAAARAPPKKDWKAESEAFRRALREARKVDQVLKAGGTAKDLPPPTYSENPNYVQCKHCNRRFAPDVAERHIPRCATTMNRPKPPPKRR